MTGRPRRRRMTALAFAAATPNIVAAGLPAATACGGSIRKTGLRAHGPDRGAGLFGADITRRAQAMEQPNYQRDAERVEARLPRPVRRVVHFMRGPRLRWVRMPLGALLVAGGFLGFLPVLGFWMIPFGLLLLAEDYPPLQRTLRRGLIGFERFWRRTRRRFARRPSA